VKKVWLVVALVTLGGVLSNAFADVQNIRLSGDIRLRGYYLNTAGGDPATGDQVSGDASFISQRTRVSVEADLEDHVLVVVTLKAEGLWGKGDEPNRSSGAGSEQSDGAINRRFDLGVSEAYLQLNELFYTPATLKVGRQYLHYGRGLILSSFDQEYNFDAARLVLDYYPLTIDLVGAQLVNGQAFSANSTRGGAADLLFVNARYEMTDSPLKSIEAYFGWIAQGNSGPTNTTFIPPTRTNGATNASPMIVGLRADLNPAPGTTIWAEGAYEFGGHGDPSGNLSAWLLNAGFKYMLRDAAWSPSVNGSYTFAQGGGDNGRHNFVPWFDYADGYNGYLFAPALSNIQIFNLGASVKPYENTTLSLQGYYYLRLDKDSPVGSNPNVDFGGPGFLANSNSHDVGWELDSILGYDYSKDVRATLVYGMFIPEGAYGDARVAHEVRAEVNVKF
jgi:hypothetical protein